jgi:23S rRNA (uracil1939-C5)-methyltransferase
VIWGVDESSLAIATAKQNARMNGVNNCRFYDESVVEKLAQAKRDFPEVDLVVVNPPRKGVQPEAMAALCSLLPGRIIYVSCDPTTLARDLDRLIACRYRAAGIQPFDMFPQTDQVETVVLLESKK